jgi:hypothetical protein
MLIAAIFCIFPTLWELYDDRNGETAEGKRRDFFLASIFYIGIAVVNLILFDIRVTCSLLLIWGIRMLIFDYLINILLFTNGVSQSGNWFEYVGKTAKFDRLGFWFMIGSWGRFSVRLVAFTLSLLYFLNLMRRIADLIPLSLRRIVPDWV